MTDATEPQRRIDDKRPAVALEWEKPAALPVPATPRPKHWTILLTSAHRGLVHDYGNPFPLASAEYPRINVVEETVAVELRQRVAQLEAENAALRAVPASADSPSTAGAAKFDEYSPLFMLLKRAIGGLSFHDEPEARAIGLEARDLLAAPAARSTAGAAKSGRSVLTIEKIVRLMDENTDRHFGLICEPFARAVEREVRAAIAAESETFAWAAFADNGNVIIWSKLRAEVEPVAAKYGKPVVPVIALNAVLAAPAVHPERQTDEVRDAALEEAALEAERMQDEYNEYQGHRWPEMRDDAATGAAACASAIRALKAAATDNGGAV